MSPKYFSKAYARTFKEAYYYSSVYYTTNVIDNYPIEIVGMLFFLKNKCPVEVNLHKL